MQLLHTAYNRTIKTHELAVLTGVGERQFLRLFTKHTGMNVTDYLQNIRVDRACDLLQSSNRKVSDIAASVGYHNVAFFNELFKKKTGVSPREFRHRNRLL
ncbi:helix-turn-helix domain-containing protein [Paenibacillus sp. LPE1-1-1.1]|uniref:helix-turn-helix domain-containing protein n=1 Tax=Paenibacillus sp. LPE1-1-1.1 TaxID=3135230 RepID=UPI0034215B11